jgi:WD40 repeat protein
MKTKHFNSKKQLLSTVQKVSPCPLLDLRGRFVLTSHMPGHKLDQLPRYAKAFPLTEKKAILIAGRRVALVNGKSKKTYWTLTCPYEAWSYEPGRALLVLRQEEQLFLWNLQTGQQIGAVEAFDYPASIAFSADGSLMAVSSYTRDIQVWRLSSGQPEERYLLCPDEEEEYIASATSIAISPDNQFIAAGDFEENTLYLWRVADGQLVNKMKYPAAKQLSMRAFNPLTQVWEEILGVPPEHGRIDGLAFSPDSQLLVNGEGSGSRYIKSMHAWDGRTGRALPGFPGASHGPIFSPDGKYLAAMGFSERRTNTITLWEVASREVVQQIQGPYITGDLAFTPSGQILVSSDSDEHVRWWDISSGQELYRVRVAEQFLKELHQPDQERTRKKSS